MKPNLLFPPVFRIIGIVLLLPGLVLGYIYIVRAQIVIFLDHSTGNFTIEVASSFTVFGLILIGFSKFKNENDQMSKTRLNALYWSVLVWSLFPIIFIIFTFLGAHLKTHHIFTDSGDFVLTYNMFLFLIVFITRLYFLLYRLKKEKKIRKLLFIPYKPYLIILKVYCVAYASIFFLAVLNFEKAGSFLTNGAYDEILFTIFSLLLPISIWSKEKNEIGVIVKTRLRSMQIAAYLWYSLFIVLTWLYFRLDYLFLLSCGFCGLLALFFIIFYSQLYLASRKMKQKLAAN